MREIKFRAWLKQEDGKFRELNPFRFIHMSHEGELYSDKDIIISQFTGLKDKNGKEIYEGDIVFDEDGEYSKTCKIEWNNESASFVGISIDDDGGFTMEEIDGVIIGNIYENHELLK